MGQRRSGGAGLGVGGWTGTVGIALLENGEGCICLAPGQAQLGFGNGHQCLLRATQKLPPSIFYHLNIATLELHLRAMHKLPPSVY